MTNTAGNPVRTIHVKNMICNCCIHLLRKELTLDGIEIQEVKLGSLTLTHDPKKIPWKKIESIVESLGFEIIRNKENILYAWTEFKLGKLREAQVLFNKVLLMRPKDTSALEGLLQIK